MTPLLYTRQDTALLLSLSLTTIDALVIGKELKPIRVGRRVMFPAVELERFTKRDHDTEVN